MKNIFFLIIFVLSLSSIGQTYAELSKNDTVTGGYIFNFLDLTSDEEDSDTLNCVSYEGLVSL